MLQSFTGNEPEISQVDRIPHQLSLSVDFTSHLPCFNAPYIPFFTTVGVTLTDFPQHLITNCIRPKFTVSAVQTLFDSPHFTNLLQHTLHQYFPGETSMTHAKTLLAKKLLNNKGLNPLWISSTSPLCKELQNWIVDTLTMENDMTNKLNDGYPPNPHLILLILGCCESNFSSRNVDKFFESQDIAAMIQSTVYNHFPMGHTHYKGSTIEGPEALLSSAPGTLFFWLNRRQGFPNNWMTFNVSQVMGTFSLWIQHRLADYLKSKSDKRSVNMSEYQRDGYSNQNHEDGAQTQSTDEELTEGIDDALINASEAETKNLLKAFVLSIPVISIKQATSMIQHSDDSWNLFVKLNWDMIQQIYHDQHFHIYSLHFEHPLYN